MITVNQINRKKTKYWNLCMYFFLSDIFCWNWWQGAADEGELLIWTLVFPFFACLLRIKSVQRKLHYGTQVIYIYFPWVLFLFTSTVDIYFPFSFASFFFITSQVLQFHFSALFVLPLHVTFYFLLHFCFTLWLSAVHFSILKFSLSFFNIFLLYNFLTGFRF